MTTNNYLSVLELSGADHGWTSIRDGWTYPVVYEPAPKPEPIYECDVFGDNASVVFFIYDKKHVPNWFRRQCQRFFIGTKWTKLDDQ